MVSIAQLVVHQQPLLLPSYGELEFQTVSIYGLGSGIGKL